MHQETIRIPIGLDAIFMRRLNELKEKQAYLYKDGVLPFKVVFEKLCRNFSITKQECWKILFLMRDYGFIDIINPKGIRVGS